MLSNDELKQSAYRYGWNSILKHFGIDDACLNSKPNKRSYCPICGGDKHSNHFDYCNKSPDYTYNCFKCGGGDGFKLLYQFNGTGFGDVAKLLRGSATSNISPSTHKPKETKADELEVTAKKLERYKKAIKYSGHTPKKWGADYLKRRGIRFKSPERKLDFIRYGSGYYMDRFIPDSNGKPTYHNCLLFPLSLHDEVEAVGFVRIYTDMMKIERALIANGDDASKLPKKPMVVKKTVDGSGVWFSKNVNNKVLHVGEGVENTLSVLQSLRLINGVASVTAGRMSKLIIPPHIVEIHIWSDSGEAGIKGAMHLKERYENQVDVIIHTPPDGKDWNDILLLENGDNAIRHEFNSTEL